MKNGVIIWLSALLFSVLASVPWLVPHTGWVALFAIVPLLFSEAVAAETGFRRFCLVHYSAFVLWNAFTTFWVCNATVGGGVFAILANALQMSVVFGIFRFGKRHLPGVLSYIFLAVLWIAWEKLYFNVQISWPWLVLGNAFATTTDLVQWYEYTGTLGGSLWIWASNLAIFGIISSWLGASWKNSLSLISSHLGLVLLVAGPILFSLGIYDRYEEKSDGKVNVIIAQPNFDPYEKFESLAQRKQNEILVSLFGSDTAAFAGPALLVAPETFTGDVVLHRMQESPTLRTVSAFLDSNRNKALLMGASTYEIYGTHSAPSKYAREYGDGWIESHNSALMLEPGKEPEVFHKSKLVVGTELTPYPDVFIPLDDWLSRRMGVGGLMGRCVGQKEISNLHYAGIPFGCAVCYESVYGEYCTGYVRKGAEFMTVITNDAWWGDTPGYRQHFSYSRLRAIELRRDIARCGNTGISAIIDQKGDVVSETPWRERTVLAGELNLNVCKTFFVIYGDIAGRLCSFMSALLALLLFVRAILKK